MTPDRHRTIFALYFQVNCSAFSPDGRTLLTASDDGCVYVWGTKSGRLLWRLAGHRGEAQAHGWRDSRALC
jgi:WD40 repeat protein